MLFKTIAVPESFINGCTEKLDNAKKSFSGNRSERDNGGEKNDTNAKMQVGFISTQLLNKLSYKVPVAQVLKKIERFSNSE